MNTSDRLEAIRLAQTHVAQRPVYLDTETTGVGKSDVIVEIAVIDYDGSILVNSLVRPNKKIPFGATNVHGITDEMVKNAPLWSEVWEKVKAVLTDRAVAIYNADFDTRLMKQSHTNNQMHWRNPAGTTFFDVMQLYAQFYGKWNPRYGNYRWQSLDAAGKQCGIALQNTHRALDDTLLTRDLLRYMAKQEK
ncbi:MAG: 3'-5' exonuclease [Chloroflexota bacterium]|nr:MAG: 3'-5' exonuclease [Chloroflexota bacterium]